MSLTALASNNFTLMAEASLTSTDYTFANGNFSCSAVAFEWHMIFSYLACLSGLFTMLSFAVPKYMFLHVYFGRAYILLLVWTTATSILIHNTGLSIAVIYTLVWCLGGMTLGWIGIGFHQSIITKKALESVEREIILNSTSLSNLNSKVPHSLDIPMRIAREKVNFYKTLSFTRKVLSWRAFHGVAMLVSWFNLCLGLVTHSASKVFECSTTPAYKASSLAGGGSITLVPGLNPKYDSLPWAGNEGGFAAGMLLVPMITSFLLICAFAYRGKQVQGVGRGGGSAVSTSPATSGMTISADNHFSY